jgi:hypothetical protein
MKTLSLVVVALSLLVAAPLAAQEKAKGKKAAAVPQGITAVQKQLEGVGLSEDQSKKVKEIVAEYTPKLQAAQKKVGDLLTAEQKKARAEAAAKIKAEGTKGKEAATALQAALKITPEQQKAYDAATAEAKETNLAFRKAVLAVLTDEQKAKTNLAGGKKPKAK